MSEHTVNQGECLTSIAYDNGFYWETLWDAGENSDLKNLRQDPRVLMPGDTVVIIDKRQNSVDGQTDRRHRFKMKGVPAKLCIQVMWDDQPRKNEAYELEIDGKKSSGNTDDQGMVKFRIPPNAQSGTLTIGAELRKRTYSLNLGSLNPIADTTGIQARLNNLGYWCGDVTGELNDATVAALKAFQSDCGLAITGQPDDDTQDKLKKANEISGGPIASNSSGGGDDSDGGDADSEAAQ
jgi:Putative peptidoglycan binding domain/LysM domain